MKSLRDMETKRNMENYCRVQQLLAKRPAEGASDDTDTEEQGVEPFVDKLSGEFLTPQPSNQTLASGAGEEEPVDSASNAVSIFHSHVNNGDLLQKSSADWRISRGLEWIEMGVRRQEIGVYTEEVVQPEPGLVVLNHRLQAAPTRQRFGPTTGTEQPERTNRPGAPTLFSDGYPAIDYPMNEDSGPQPAPQAAASTGFPEEPPGEGGTVTRTDSQSMTTRVSQSSDTEASSGVWSFSKNLKSPGLRRRRPTSVHQGAPTRQSFRDLELPRSVSLPSSGSDYNLNTDSSSLSSQQSSDSQQLLRLASSKPNQEMSCDPQDEQFFSESELPNPSASDRWLSLRQQRRYSNPSIATGGHHKARVHTRSLHSFSSNAETQLTGLPSRLDGVLNRAKVRVRERDGLTTERQVKIAHRRTRYPPPSASLSATLSPSPSDVDRDTEWVGEVALMRHRALMVSKGWKEQLVDGDDDDKKDRSDSVKFLLRFVRISINFHFISLEIHVKIESVFPPSC